MADRPLPDPVDVVRDWLVTLPAVTEVTGKRISWRLTGTYPAIRLTDVGPIDSGPEEATVRVQVECWAEGDTGYETARRLAADVVAAAPAAGGPLGGGYCAGLAVIAGPFANPDVETNRHRHQLDLAVHTAPAPTT